MESICLNNFLFFQINGLHCVADYEFYVILRTTRTIRVFLGIPDDADQCSAACDCRSGMMAIMVPGDDADHSFRDLGHSGKEEKNGK